MKIIYRVHSIMWYGYKDQYEETEDYDTLEEAIGNIVKYIVKQNTENYNQWNEKYPDKPMWITQEQCCNAKEAETKIVADLYTKRIYKPEELQLINKRIREELEQLNKEQEYDNKCN